MCRKVYLNHIHTGKAGHGLDSNRPVKIRMGQLQRKEMRLTLKRDAGKA